MGRHCIEALIYVEVDADGPEEAYEHFADGLDEIPRLHSLEVRKVEQKVKPFDLPPGAERWRDVAADIRFGDDRWESTTQRLCGFHDGSWWWTDGHVLLRCDGHIPADENVWRRIPDEIFTKAFVLKRKRSRTIAWSSPRHVHRTVAARHSLTTPPVYLDSKYIRLGECGGVTEWRVGNDPLVPVHGVDDDGRLVMVIAPMTCSAQDWEAAKVA